MGERGDDAAFGGAVEFGDDETGDAQRFVKRLYLRQRVLAVVGVQHNKHFVRCARQRLVDHAFDLFDLFHQMQLRGQAPGGIGQHDIDAARGRRLYGVVHHRSGVAPGLADDGNVIARAPFGQLLACRGAKGVAGGQQHGFTLRLPIMREFADGGGFARAIHPREQDHRGLVPADI